MEYKITKINYGRRYFCIVDDATTEYANGVLQLGVGRKARTLSFKINKEQWKVLKQFIDVEEIELIDWLGVDREKFLSSLGEYECWLDVFKDFNIEDKYGLFQKKVFTYCFFSVYKTQPQYVYRRYYVTDEYYS